MFNNVITKPRNLYIIEIEGLDATGKETFCKSLQDYISEFDWSETGLRLLVHSFPTYDTSLGKKIKEILNTPHEERDNQLLDDLMFYDRIDQMMKLMVEIRESTVPTILILDRYHFSNFVYSAQSDYITQERFKLEVSTLPKPNMVVHFIPTDEKSKEIHKKQIEEKSDKDLNEVYDFQEKLLAKYIDKFNYSSSVYADYDSNINGMVSGDITLQMIVPVGSNYNNFNKESEILSVFKGWLQNRYRM